MRNTITMRMSGLANLILFLILFLFLYLKFKNEKQKHNENERLDLHPRYPMHITVILFDIVFDFADALCNGGHVAIAVVE